MTHSDEKIIKNRRCFAWDKLLSPRRKLTAQGSESKAIPLGYPGDPFATIFLLTFGEPRVVTKTFNVIVCN